MQPVESYWQEGTLMARSLIHRLLQIVALVALLVLQIPSQSQAATPVVTNSTITSAGTLREANSSRHLRAPSGELRLISTDKFQGDTDMLYVRDVESLFKRNSSPLQADGFQCSDAIKQRPTSLLERP